jgi:hypothetical protein
LAKRAVSKPFSSFFFSSRLPLRSPLLRTALRLAPPPIFRLSVAFSTPFASCVFHSPFIRCASSRKILWGDDFDKSTNFPSFRLLSASLPSFTKRCSNSTTRFVRLSSTYSAHCRRVRLGAGEPADCLRRREGRLTWTSREATGRVERERGCTERSTLLSRTSAGAIERGRRAVG